MGDDKGSMQTVSGPSGEPAVHVTPYGRVWAVRRSDEGAPVSQHLHLMDAIAEGRALALSLHLALTVYDASWSVVSREPASVLTAAAA